MKESTPSNYKLNIVTKHYSSRDSWTNLKKMQKEFLKTTCMDRVIQIFRHHWNRNLTMLQYYTFIVTRQKHICFSVAYCFVTRHTCRTCLSLSEYKPVERSKSERCNTRAKRFRYYNDCVDSATEACWLLKTQSSHTVLWQITAWRFTDYFYIGRLLIFE